MASEEGRRRRRLSLARAAASRAGWPRSRAELSRGCRSRLWGPRHGPGLRPARPAPPQRGRHAQAREATQVPGPRRLLWPRWARGRALPSWGGGREGPDAPRRALACPLREGPGPGLRGAGGLGGGRGRGGRPLRDRARSSDRGGLRQLGSGRREVRTGQESRRQCRSAGSKISLWLGSLSGSCSGSSFWGWGAL